MLTLQAHIEQLLSNSDKARPLKIPDAPLRDAFTSCTRTEAFISFMYSHRIAPVQLIIATQARPETFRSSHRIQAANKVGSVILKEGWVIIEPDEASDGWALVPSGSNTGRTYAFKPYSEGDNISVLGNARPLIHPYISGADRATYNSELSTESLHVEQDGLSILQAAADRLIGADPISTVSL